MGKNLEAAVTHRPQRHIGVVKVNDLRIVLIDKVDGTVVDTVAISLVGRSDVVGLPVPLSVVAAERMTLFVKILNVIAFPPRAFAIGLGLPAIVAHAFQWAFLVAAA